MKKYLIIIISAIITAGFLTACASGASGTAKGDAEGENRLQIVTTIFPEYDWVMNILGNNPADAEVSMLLDNGVDLHMPKSSMCFSQSSTNSPSGIWP